MSSQMLLTQVSSVRRWATLATVLLMVIFLLKGFRFESSANVRQNVEVDESFSKKSHPLPAEGTLDNIAQQKDEIKDTVTVLRQSSTRPPHQLPSTLDTNGGSPQRLPVDLSYTAPDVRVDPSLSKMKTTLATTLTKPDPSCTSSLWVSGSSSCSGKSPTVPSDLRKYQNKLVDKRVKLLHAAKCSYPMTKPLLETELAIVWVSGGAMATAGSRVINDRVDMLLSAYGAHFSRMAIVSSSLNFTTSVHGDVILWHCIAHGDTRMRKYLKAEQYVCVAKLLQWISKQGKYDNLRGLTFFHMDMWLHPAFIAYLIRDHGKDILSVSQSVDGWPECVAWLPKWRCRPLWTDHTCYNISTFWSTKFVKALSMGTFGGKYQDGSLRVWKNTYKGSVNLKFNLMWQTFLKMDEELVPPENSANGSICHGWVDMYRLPRQYWETFIKYSLVFDTFPDKRDRFLEVVLPTFFRKLVTKSGQRVRMIECLGGTNADFDDPNIFKLYPCGHRMRLDLLAVRRGFQEAVRCG